VGLTTGLVSTMLNLTAVNYVASNRTLVVGTVTVVTIFVILAGACMALWLKTSATYARINDIDAHFDKIQGSLDEIRNGLWQSSVHAIECKTDPAACKAVVPSKISNLRDSSTRRLQELESPLQGPERARVTRLRAQMNDFWNSLEGYFWSAFRSGRPAKPSSAVVPHPSPDSAVSSLVTDLDGLSRASLAQQQQSIRSIEKTHRSYIRVVALTGLILITLTAGGGFFQVSRLERVADREQARATKAEQELRALAQDLLKVQEVERQQISRELHDEVGQLLTGLRMELGNLGKLGGAGDSHEYEQSLNHAKTLAEDAMRSIRNIAMLLRPPMLDDLGLESALRWQAREFSGRLGVPVILNVQADLEGLPDQYTTCLYRIAQEALNNCAKHAGAKEIQVNVRNTEDGITLTVEDDGIGFMQEKSRSAGLGLIGIEERARELNGRAIVSARSTGGTRVEVALPVPASVAS